MRRNGVVTYYDPDGTTYSNVGPRRQTGETVINKGSWSISTDGLRVIVPGARIRVEELVKFESVPGDPIGLSERKTVPGRAKGFDTRPFAEIIRDIRGG